MMKRSLALILVLIILIGPGNGLAQGPELTETYSDELITFRYPAGWIVTLNEDGDPTLSNESPEDIGLFMPEAGIVKINIGPFDLADTGDFEFGIEEFEGGDIALFMTGFYSGLAMAGYQLVASFASAFSEDQIESSTTLSRLEVVDGGYLAEINMRTGEAGIDMLIITTETYVIAVGASANELDQWTDTIFAIADTVTVNP